MTFFFCCCCFVACVFLFDFIHYVYCEMIVVVSNFIAIRFQSVCLSAYLIGFNDGYFSLSLRFDTTTTTTAMPLPKLHPLFPAYTTPFKFLSNLITRFHIKWDSTTPLPILLFCYWSSANESKLTKYFAKKLQSKCKTTEYIYACTHNLSSWLAKKIYICLFVRKDTHVCMCARLMIAYHSCHIIIQNVNSNNKTKQNNSIFPTLVAVAHACCNFISMWCFAYYVFFRLFVCLFVCIAYKVRVTGKVFEKRIFPAIVPLQIVKSKRFPSKFIWSKQTMCNLL